MARQRNMTTNTGAYLSRKTGREWVYRVSLLDPPCHGNSSTRSFYIFPSPFPNRPASPLSFTLIHRSRAEPVPPASSYFRLFHESARKLFTTILRTICSEQSGDGSTTTSTSSYPSRLFLSLLLFDFATDVETIERPSLSSRI